MPNSLTTPPACMNEASEGRLLPKLCGADVELGNFLLGVESAKGTGAIASQLLLREIAGRPLHPEHEWGGPAPGPDLTQAQAAASSIPGPDLTSAPGSGGNPQDWGRKFLPANGGCAYIDLDHLELCLPEVLSAHDHVAVSHAMLRTARSALQAANARLSHGLKVVALANNSDGQGNSYGSHLDFLITRRAWENLFARRLHSLLFLATYQVSSIVFTGQGKVGSENRTPPVPYQISQRADFFETLTGVQTTFNRPIVNSRHEPLCGTWRDAPAEPATAHMARLHVIFYDHTLCHAASLLKVGVLQIILAMIEAGEIKAELALEDPLDALVRWSHDPELGVRARLTSGRQLTATELQLLFWEEAERFVATGACQGIVPDAEFIVSLWGDTLAKLCARDYAGLAPRLDWVLKWQVLQRARQPFNVNGVAAAAAIAALDDNEFVAHCRRENQAGLAQLGGGLAKLGLEFVPGQGNFLLVKVGDGARVFGALQQRGLIVRPVKPYGLPEWVRITVGTRAQNERLLAALAEVRPA